MAADSFALVSVFKTARRRQVEERTRVISAKGTKMPTGAGKRLSILTLVLRVENQRSPVPQGAARRGFSEKSGRQGKVREEAEQRDVSDHRACLYR